MDHPRPQLARERFISLDGSWDFSVVEPETGTAAKPGILPSAVKKIGTAAKRLLPAARAAEDPQSAVKPRPDLPHTINVPYPPEAPLSGVGRHFPEGSVLRYRRSFSAPALSPGERLLLHIDGVDQQARVFFNGKDLGTVCTVLNGPASLDITPWLQPDNTLIITVTDDLRDRRFPYGKQSLTPGGMWYTPVSGIWQSVWLEPVPKDFVRGLKITPSLTSVHIKIDGPKEGVIRCEGAVYPFKNGRVTITPAQPHLWSPEDPYLYRFTVTAGRDTVHSYFALRKVEVRGRRILLNGKPVFLHGLLDQGYFPDGLWTPPAADSFEKDILAAKALGFNMLRKHIKIEPERFYYDCDRLGMLVFQDMINNGRYSFARDTALPTAGFTRLPQRLRRHSRACKKAFLQALSSTVRRLYNHPCICGWTIFNEGWGQFSGDEAYNDLSRLDSTRVIDAASGWFAGGKTDVDSRHVYFRKFRMPKGEKPVILSEFGGYVWKIPEHSADPEKTYGYRTFKTQAAWMDGLEALYKKQIIPAAQKGLCGAVYTQLTDVEEECNGLLTYDRAVCKADAARMQALAAALRDAALQN